jgi:hypothetical protein
MGMAMRRLGSVVWLCGLGCASSDDGVVEASTRSAASTTASPTGGAETTRGTPPAGSTGTASTDAGTPDDSGATSSITTDEPPRPELCPPGVDTPTLEIGHGHGDFLPIESGPAVLVMGEQGGFHITLGLRVSGFDLADWGSAHLHAELDGQVVSDHDAVVPFTCLDELEPPLAQALWINVIFDVGPDELLGQTIEVTVDAADYTGVSVSETLTLPIDDVLR